MPKPKHRTTQSQRTPTRNKTFLPAGTGSAPQSYRKARLAERRVGKVPAKGEVRIGSQAACRRMRRAAAASLNLMAGGHPSVALYRSWARGMRVNPGQMSALATLGKVMALNPELRTEAPLIQIAQ